MKSNPLIRPRGPRASRRRPRPPALPVRRRSRPEVEELEPRCLLTVTPPSIVYTGPPPVTTPADGSSTAPSAHPAIVVVFSEDMVKSEVETTSNWSLFGTSGNSISIDSVKYDGTAHSATISYNGGNDLVVDNYTLYVRGDKVHDNVGDGLALANAGGLVVANQGQGNAAVVEMPGDGTLAAASNYALPAVGSTNPGPVTAAFADLDGDGIQDLIVVNSGSEQVAIFQGQTAADGGGYALTPTLTLDLPSGIPNKAKGIVVADFNKDKLPDIAIANADNNNVTVFLNTSPNAGTIAFGAGTNYAAGNGPVAIVSADFNGDGNLDLAVANGTVNGTKFQVTVLAGDGTGSFAAGATVDVGDAGNASASPPVAASGLQTPNSLAAAPLGTGTLSDLVVGGANGIEEVLNQSTGGKFTFSAQSTTLFSLIPVTSLAIGSVGSATHNNIVATSTNNGGEVLFFQNDGKGNFLQPTSYITGGSPTGVTLQDINNDKKNEILVVNNSAAGQVQALTLTSAKAGDYVTNATTTKPITITSKGHGLQNNQTVSVAGVGGDLAANGTWTVTNTTTDTFDLSGSDGTSSGTYTSGGSWQIVGTVTGATNAGPIVITTVGHGLSTGDVVTITGVTGNTAANGTWTITRVDADHFSLNGSNGNGAYTTGTGTWAKTNLALFGGGGGAVTDATNAGPIVITSAGHGLATGDMVNITGVGGNPAANGTWVITKVDADHFSLNGSNGNGTYTAGTGTWNKAASYTVGGNPMALAVADTNGDGNPDIVTVNNGDNDFTLLQGDGDGTFDVSTNISLSPQTGATAVAVGDLNGDGLNDVVIANSGSSNTTSTLSILLATAPNVYAKPITLSPFVGQPNFRGMVSVAIGNVFHHTDGLVDIVVASQTDNKVAVLKNTTTGGVLSFALNNTYTVGTTPTQVTLADLNGDGNLDMLVSHNGSGRFATRGVTLLLGKSDGTFFNSGTVTNATNAGPIVITSANHGLHDNMTVTVKGVNGNTAANGTFKIKVVDADHFQLLGSGGNGAYTGGGTWSIPSEFETKVHASSVAVGDFNKDGIPDFVVADDNAPGAVVLDLGNGLGGFTSGGSFAVGVNPGNLAVADFNRDGYADVVAVSKAYNTTDQVSVLINSQGSGFNTFVSSQAMPGVGLRTVAVANVNQDVFPDLIVSSLPGKSGAISAASNASPIKITSNNHGLSTGDIVTITGVGGNTAANGTWTITKVDNNTFTLNGSKGNGTYTKNTGTWTVGSTIDNLFTLQGNGDGSFQSALPYLAAQFGGQVTAQAATPSAVAVVNDAFLRVTTFATGGKTVKTDLILNGNFEALDASGAKSGTLVGWQTYNLPDPATGGSHGDFLPQTGTTSPLSGTTMPSPNGGFAAVLDQANLVPLQKGQANPNSNADYQGSHALYQDVLIPTNATAATLSFNLYLDNSAASTGSWSDTQANPPNSTLLDYRTLDDNQQVRVDIVDPQGVPNSGLISNILIKSGSITIVSKNHGLVSGQRVSISGVNGVSGANGSFLITKVDDNQFTLNGATGSGVYTGGGIWDVTGNITDATDTGPIIITSTDHGLISGQLVRINDVTGNTGANGTFTVAVVDKDHFSLINSQGNGAYTGGGTWTLLRAPILDVGSSGAITDASSGGTGPIVITSANHGLVTGARVYITGVAGNTNANGIFTVTRIDSNRFSLDNTTSNGTYAGGGTWSSGVFQNLFQTTPSQSNVETVSKTANLLAFAGLPIRIRFAATNNRGKLIVSVDNVSLKTTFADSTNPTLSNLALRNPGFVDSHDGLFHTTDPTFMGKLGDNGTVNNIAYIGIDTNNDGFDPNDPKDVKLTTWDPVGNFSYTLSNLSFGAHTINFVAVDKAGNVSSTASMTFFYQGPDLTDWQAFGPAAIDTTGQGVDYKNVTGRVSAVLVDPSDPNGNTLLIGAPNGGIWRSTDGGIDWTPETDYLTDKSGNPIAAPISALAVSASNPAIMYAGTGVADNSFDSRPGIGVLKSTDGGKTWGLVGNSDTVLGGARVTKVVVDNDDPNTVYVAVASGGISGPGVYKSTDGGQTWVNVLDPAKMFLAGSSSTLGAGTALASVTDLLIDPFDSNRLLVALGNMGLVTANSTAGLWVSTNKGATWLQELGGFNGGGSLPNGSNVGRVTLAIGSGRPGDEKYLYVLIGTVIGNNTPPNHDQGSMSGLYRSSDGLLTFTKVMLRQNEPSGSPGTDSNGRPLPDVNYVDINILGQDASYAGALLVDPTDPNVVYVGGSRRYDSKTPGDPTDTDHVLIRVDTGNMDPATGDDKTKEATAATKSNDYDTNPPYNPGGSVTYKGEGVSWYDLEQGVFSGTSNKRYLPPAIHGLAFDPLGRLVIATEGGVFRGQGYGFGYDFTSGGGNGGGSNSSIVGGQPPKVPGMTFISLNSNLQIAELNSVAIDHTQPGVYYTANVGTGTSTSLGLLQWVSSGLTGPVVNGVNLNIPTAAFIKIAGTDPSQPVGTPSNVYRGWLFADPGALLPEVSTDGGNSFSPIGTTGIPNNLTGGLFPAFAVSTNKVLNSGNYEDVLLFGADRVYTSNTSGNLWLKPTPDVALSTGSITAMAIAPSNANVQYVGTDKGEVFVKDASSGTSFTLRVSGLPSGVKVNGITVDPNDPSTAYVLLGGTGIDHVWRTKDAGNSWTDISGNLPSVPTYALVALPQPVLGAPQGRLLVATDVGVFASLDNGSSWNRFGQGIPNVPIVDLEYDPSQQVLVAASQGRGLFVLSTDRSQSTVSTPGIFDPSSGLWLLRNDSGGGAPDIGLFYGWPGAQPVVGDWNGDKVDTIGIYYNGLWLLRNSNSPGGADIGVYFGWAGAIPLVGDWTGSGHDSIGIFDPNTDTFYLKYTISSGPADIAFQYGWAGVLPVAGDWTGSGHDGIGIYDPRIGLWLLRNSATAGGPDIGFFYGFAGTQPVVGDWNGDGKDTAGVYYNGLWLVRNSNTGGGPDLGFYYGWAGTQAVAGDYNGPGNPLQLAGEAIQPDASTPLLTGDMLQSAITMAVASWAAAGLDPARQAALRNIHFAVADLPGTLLGLEQSSTAIFLDRDAAGHGWSLTPAGGTPDPQRVDLVSAVAHEMGHALGLPDVNATLYPRSVMGDLLPLGVRRLPTAADVDALFSNPPTW